MTVSRASGLLAPLLLLGLLAGCRAADRTKLAMFELGALPRERRTLSEYERLAGANPQLGLLWLQTIYVDPRREPLPPEEAAEHARRALRFLPGAPELQLALADMTARHAGPEAARAPLEAGLARLPSSPAEAALRARLVETLLETLDAERAEQQALRLSASPASHPAQRAVAWAGVALAWEVLGEPDAADRALDRSLHQHPYGLERLAEAAAQRPERAAAARALRARAAERVPWHPDVQLQRTGDLLAAGELDAARERLARLPAPLPERLHGAHAVLEARLLAEGGEPDAGAARLVAHLERRPRDLLALQALLLLWQEHGSPERETVLARLRAALGDPGREAGLPEPVRRALIDAYEQIDAAGDALPPDADA